MDPRRGLLPSGAPSGPNIPTGSPLSPFRTRWDYSTPPIMAPIGDDQLSDLPPPLPSPPPRLPEPTVERTSSLPTPPPSVSKRPSIWDKEHISETFAKLGAGFFAGHNFGDGLGAAANTIAEGTAKLREEGRKSVAYGGPNDQFEITTDPTTGQRTVREVPEFAAAVEKARSAEVAPTPKDNIDFRSRAIHAISQLPVEQRQAAYADLIQNPASYGIETAGMPTEWSDTYGGIAGGMGLNVNQSLTADYRDRHLGHRVETDRARLGQGQARIDQGAARVAQGAERLRKAPPSTRKPQGFYEPRSRAEFNNLPTGAKYRAPDGSLRIKP